MISNIFSRAIKLKSLNVCSIEYKYSSSQLHQNRINRQQQQQKLIYSHQPQKLIKSPIQLKYLVPTNIFEEQVLIQQYPKTLVDDKKVNQFENSYAMINLKIKENLELRNTLMRYTQKHVRFGRLLEIMDMIAGVVSYRHCFGSFKKNNPFTLVTGSVQSMQLFQPLTCEQNIQVQGFINHTGKTSMQIQINIHQSKQLKSTSFFTMVCRNSNDLSKGYQVPQLQTNSLSSEQLKKAQLRKLIALNHIHKRKSQISESFDFRPPSNEQIKQIHELFLQQKSQKSIEFLKKKEKISSTYVQTNEIMHLQDRNVHGKIFGGFLMREMLQIGWFAAKKFLNGKPFQIQGITDIYFLSAVQIGLGLTIGASVTYTQQKIVIITVQAHTTNFQFGQKKLCCSAQLIIETQQKQVQNVYPDSYAEALKYLTSRRTFSKGFISLQNEIK